MTETKTSCAVCAAKGGPFFGSRGTDWPTTTVTIEGREFVVHKCCVREAQSAARVATEAEGPIAYRWKSNGNCVPGDVMRVATHFGIVSPEAEVITKATRDVDTRQFLAQYRAAQAAKPSEEERAEARAAFGLGETVVDAITGRTYTT